ARQVASHVPGAPGGIDSVTIADLLDGHTVWVAVRSSNPCGRWSALSNVLAVTPPAFPPAAVSDLQAPSSTDSTVVLLWTASGEDGTQGRVQFNQVRATTGTLDSAGFAAATLGADVPSSGGAGLEEGCVLRGLRLRAHLQIGVRAVDAAGNVSGISNVIRVTLG